LLLPENCHLLVQSIAFVPVAELAPRVSFANSGWLGSKGFVHLSATSPPQTLSYDSTTVTGAQNTMVEISRANLFFENQNTRHASAVKLKDIRLSGKSGTLILKRDMFPAVGIYELRPWALDSEGKTTGVAGDHIVISVDS
jgi:hypothetical protein